MPDIRELTIEDRVKKILSAVPSAMASDAQVIALTVALALGGTDATERIERLADDIAGLQAQQHALRQQYTALRDGLEAELSSMTAMSG